MEPRPVADQIAGIDAVLCRAAALEAGRDVAWEPVRIAAASSVRRHNEVLRRLERDEETRWLVIDGIVAWWDDDAIEVIDGLPRGGGELEAVAAAVLDEGIDGLLEAVVAARAAVQALIAEQGEDIAEAVTLDILESLMLASLAA